MSSWIRAVICLMPTLLVWACEPASPPASVSRPSEADPDAGAKTATTLAWTVQPKGPASRDHHATFLHAGDGVSTLYVSGGIDEPSNLPRPDLWYAHLSEDGSVNAWKKGPAPTIWQTGHGATVAGERAYLVSGKTITRGKLEMTPKVFSLGLSADGKPNAWREEKPLPAPRFHGSANAFERWVYVVGGMETQPAKGVKSVYRSEIGEDGWLSSWTEMTPLPEERTHHATVIEGRRIYVLGGLDGSGIGYASKTFDDALVADIDEAGALGPWRRLPLGFEISTHGATVVDGQVYVLGGLNGQLKMLDTVRRARIAPDGTLGEWESMTSLPSPRAHVHQVPSFGSAAYFVAGNTGNHVPTDEVLTGTLR